MDTWEIPPLILPTIVVIRYIRYEAQWDPHCQSAGQARGLALHLAPLAWCTDNAAMIGLAACRRLAAGQRSGIDLGVAPRFPLAEADALYGQPPF